MGMIRVDPRDPRPVGDGLIRVIRVIRVPWETACFA